MGMIAIKCKSGKIFSATVAKYIDAEWKLQAMYYKAQGCIIDNQESVTMEDCNCDHCQSLEHNYEELIEEIKNLKPN
jgi:hypothetical protein